MPRSLAVICCLAIGVAACSSSAPKRGTDTTTTRASNESTTTPGNPTTTADPATPSSTSSTVGPAKSANEIRAIRLALKPVATGLDRPVAATPRANDELLYVAEQHKGRVLAIATGGASNSKPRVVLDLRGAVAQGNEQGLLGLAFSVDGSKLFVHYNDPKGDSRVVEYSMSPAGIALTASRREILRQDQPFPNHNGGQLEVDANDLLYIGFGDGGLAGDPLKSGQDLGSLLGKILRIDPRPSGSSPYQIPSDNPFVQRTGARGEIWQWGLRNPWRFSFDRQTNDLWIGDVGQNVYEEVDHIAAGRSGVNFGWNKREGTHSFNGGKQPEGAVDPVFDYSHEDGGCSVTGGYVYRGTAIKALQGVYVFADYCAGNLIGISAEPNADRPANAPLGVRVQEPTSFAQNGEGEIFVLSGAGSIAQITAR